MINLSITPSYYRKFRSRLRSKICDNLLFHIYVQKMCFGLGTIYNLNHFEESSVGSISFCFVFLKDSRIIAYHDILLKIAKGPYEF